MSIISQNETQSITYFLIVIQLPFEFGRKIGAPAITQVRRFSVFHFKISRYPSNKVYTPSAAAGMAVPTIPSRTGMRSPSSRAK